MDLGDWLGRLGLGQYEAVFRESEVDADVLPELTEQHLKDLGVPLGHRLKMLRGIRELAESASRQTPLNSMVETAERRQLTVMFCDLVGSTALSAKMDPEDMRGIIGAYHRSCAAEITRSGGYVAKYMGDGVLAYFGYPRAHEHDAERAVAAGLAIVEAVPKLKTAAEAVLHVRVGIATGIVVVGDLIGSGEAQERGIVGDTPNLAARLQGMAGPDQVIVADGTRKLVGDLFELEDLGVLLLKGIPTPTRAWAALRTNPIESRFEALHARGVTSLVGREEEVELLLQRWSLAKSGEGQAILLSGEAGIGKSRLTVALMERLENEPHMRLRYFCSPQHTGSSFFPIISQMERAAGLARDDPAKTKLDKLDTLLARSSTTPSDAALFAEMLSLPNDGRYPTSEVSPEQRRRWILQALVSQTEALSRQEPLLMIYEDVHWTDPTSLEAFGRVVDRIRTLRVLLLVTSRPEFEAPWTGQPHVTTLSISRLKSRDVAAMIDLTIGNNLVPEALRQDIIERTDGVPLFVEEMTKAVLEAESEGEARRTAAAAPPSAMRVPPSLHASLMARLDRLGAAKEVAQIGAAIGREFSHGLLAAVAGKPDIELESAVDRLIGAGLLFRHGVASDHTYLFKHALVQDTAYGTLLRESRRALHARIAEVLQSQFVEIAERQPELLARHYTEAALVEKAAGFWCKAGRQSLARSAFIEAVAHFTRGLAQFENLPVAATLLRERIEAQVGLGNALIDVKGHAASETRAAFLRARELMKQTEEFGESLDDPLLRLSVLYGLWINAYVAFNGDLMHEIAAEFLALAEEQGAAFSLTSAHRLMGWTLTLTGNVAEGRARSERSFARYDPNDASNRRERVGPTDPLASALSTRALMLWLLGYPEAAQAAIDQAIGRAREVGEAATLMLALGITNYTNILCRNAVDAKAHADELVVLADEKGASLRKAEAVFQQGCALALSGRFAEAIQMITAGVKAWRATGATCWTPLQMSFLAGVHAKLGQLGDARRCIDEAMAASAASKESWCDADIHRIAGEITLLSDERDTAEAETYFRRALAVAREQQAKSFELRAATSLAKLLRSRGEGSAARDLLASVYGWFTEGHETRDLREAKEMLDSL